ncbi:MAG TPA: beta-propeller fold lactonase family protein [Roseiflexaceae bacterium]|nr:beta-propeller fold lactonase family protein [Roseiflexaceae bacterium]
MHLRPLLALTLFAALALLAVPVPRVHAAASIQVDPSANDANDANDGKCSLWEALQAIGQGSTYNNCTLPGGASGPFTITFTSVGTVKVTGGTLPYVTKNVAITGPVIIEGNGNDTTMVVAGSGILSLANLTMTKGDPAIITQTSSSVLNIAGCSFIDNSNDSDGGAISSSGKLNIAGSVFTANTSDGTDGGGAIWASGFETLAVAGTIFNGNIARRSGGAIYAKAPAVLTDVIFNGNIANGIDPNNNGTDGDPSDDYEGQGGGAIFARNDSQNDRKLTLTRAVFNGNITGQGHGGALFNNIGSTVEIQDSSFNGNLAGKPPATERRGGALANLGGTLRMARSTLLNNAVVGHGGGFVNDRGGQATLSNVGFTANAATGDGGAIYNVNTQQGSPIRPKLVLLNATLDMNVAQGQGGGIFAQAPSNASLEVVLPTNVIVSRSDGPGLGGNCAGGGVQSQGHNLDTGASCGFTEPGDLQNADPKLEAPFFNGGPLSSLLSQKLLAGSAASDAGDDAVCAAAPVGGVDVRGDSRPKGARCDIGAFEAEPPVAGFGSSPVRPGPVPFGNVTFGQSQDADISVFNTGDAPLQLSGPTISGPNAADFALLTPFPLNVSAPTNVTLRCAPTGSTPGQRTATLNFSTNDPAAPGVSFTLTCNATAQPIPGFGSTPAAPGPLDFGTVIVGQTKNGGISFDESGTAPLTVNNAVLGGANPGDFSVGGGFNVTIADGAAPVVGAVSCAPTAPGIRSATLTVSTNDPTKPTVTFNLACTGKTLPPLALDVPGATSTGGGVPALLGPYGVAISPDGKHVYVAGRTSNTVHTFVRDPLTGELGANPVQSFTDPGGNLNGAIRVYVSQDGTNVYVTAQSAGRVLAYSRDPVSGLLTPLDSVANGDSYACFPGPCQQIGGLAGAYGVALSPDGQFLYVSGSASTAGGGSAINVFRRDPDGGLVGGVVPFVGPRFVERVAHADLEGVYDLALSPDGVYLYAASYSNNPDTITVFRRNAQDGRLSYVDTVDAAEVSRLAGVFRLGVSQDGTHLYAASYDSDALLAFRRSPADGKLTHVASYFDGGQDAVGQVIDGLDAGTSVAFSPDGRLVYASGFNDAAVVAFERDGSTGELVFVQAVKRNASGQPPLAGARDIAVSPDGRTIHASGFSDNRVVTLKRPNPKPTLESLAPASVTATNGAITLTVNGADFVPGAVVRWNNAVNLPTTFVHSGKLTASVGVGLLATAGARPVAVINPGPGGGTSNALTFTVTAPAENPVPSIDELSPAGAPAGGPAVTITLKGANFMQQSLVRWNGQDRPTIYISPTTLQFQAPSADVAQPGDAAVTVANPAPGGGTSNAVAFSVAPPGEHPVPAITVLSPAYATAGANGAIDLTILGSNFVEGAQAQWNGEDRPTTFVSAGELRMAVNAADLLDPGTASVQVVNPGPGGGPSNVAGFRIGAADEHPLPALRRVAAVATNGDGSLTLTLDGSGLIAASQAHWNSQPRATALVSATRLTMIIAASDFTGGTATITVTNPGPGGGTSDELLYTITRLHFPVVRK